MFFRRAPAALTSPPSASQLRRSLYARDERLQQFRLAASAHVRDDFDVGRAGYTFQLVKVSGSLDQFYRFSPR